MKPLLTIALLLLLPLLVPAAHSADIPRYRITIPSGLAHQDAGGGAVQFIGTATALVRVRGLAVLIDPGAESELPAADVVVLPQPQWGRRDVPAWSLGPVVAAPGPARELRALGFRSVYPLDTWEGITVRKGDTRLRLTSLPDTHGMRPEAMALMLDFGPACRVYVHGAALSRDEIGMIPQRFPGARLALLREAGTPLLLTVAQNGREASLERPVLRGAPYRFGTANCR